MPNRYTEPRGRSETFSTILTAEAYEHLYRLTAHRGISRNKALNQIVVEHAAEHAGEYNDVD